MFFLKQKNGVKEPETPYANSDHRDLVLKSQNALMDMEDPMGTQFIPKMRIESG